MRYCASVNQLQTPESREAARRANFARSLERDLRGGWHCACSHPSGDREVPDEAALPMRRDAVQAASDTGEIMARQSYADFDIVRIGADDAPESVARALSQRPEVEYAQAPNRFHTTFVPNDPLYSTMQWNLPMLNLERAWDIQPQAGSTITVAVLDTGMAIQNLTITATLPAFRDEFGDRYPALGRRDDSVLGGATTGRRLGCRAHRRALRILSDWNQPSARLRWPWHARQRHDWPADQRQHRHRRSGVQRQADAGEGSGERVGCDFWRRPRNRRK